MSQAPGTAVDICNLALDRIGQNSAVNIDTPTTPSEDVCARHYDQTRRELLREYIFNFARKPVILTVNPNAPTHPEFVNGYNLPNDFVRLLTIGDRILYGGNTPSVFYDISDGVLYCDDRTALTDSNGDPITGLQIKYIFDAVVVPKFDSLFIKVFKLQLASNIAYKFTLKASLKTDLEEELKAAHLKAAAISGQEKPPVRVQRSRLRDVRRSGGIFRNNTVIGGP